jgi:2-amino-4,5-dihydroxy-6-oxo-7-(phosphonooxy)heptanoate synthase
MLDITAASPVPVLVAGGPPHGSEAGVLGFVRNALDGGAAGVAMGRNIFASADPERLAGKVARLVHQFPGDRLEDLIGGQQDDRRQAVLA